MSKHLPPKKNKHEKAEAPSKLNLSFREKKTSHGSNEIRTLNLLNCACIAGAAAFCAAGFLVAQEGWLPLCLFAAAFLIGSAQILLLAAEKLLRLKLLEADILVLLSGIFSFSLGNYGGAVVLILCYRLLRLGEGYFEKQGREMALQCSDFLPKSAKLASDTGVQEIEPERIAEEDVLTVEAGEIFPVDGEIIEGISTMDLSPLAPEMANIAIGVGSPVLCGAVNITDTVKIKAACIYSESGAVMLSQYLDKAARYKSKLEKFAARFERFSVPAFVLAALLTGLVMPIFNGNWSQWLNRGSTLLAVAAFGSLCSALGNLFCSGLLAAKKRGIYFKGTCFFASLAHAETFVFNKTGTLTEGRYTLVDIVPRDISEQELLALAAHAECHADHPIARAICLAYGIDRDAQQDIVCEEIPGRGVKAVFNGKRIYVGNAALMADQDIDCPITRKGGIAIHVSVNSTYAGHLILQDRVRENAFDQLETLRIKGVKNMITLTADMHSVARPLAASLNMDMVRAELNPAGKLSAVEYLAATKAEHSELAFVCNAAGDAEVLRRADVGISLGALGSIEAYECADVLIMGEKLGALSEAVGLSQTVNRSAAIAVLSCFLGKLLLLVLAFSGVTGVLSSALIELVVNLAVNLMPLNILRYYREEGSKQR